VKVLAVLGLILWLAAHSWLGLALFAGSLGMVLLDHGETA
jgi:hypothetical protein